MKLIARNLRFSYRQRTVLDGIDLRLEHGEVVCLLGANGAGKSTLLRLLLGLLKPADGQISLGDRPLEQWPRRQLARQLAYVPQVHVTPFPYTVSEVVLLGRLPASNLFHAPRVADHTVVEQVLTHLGIAHLAQRPYTEISGGERQLALIARALAQGARLLIMDEPATGLDYGHQLRLLERLAGLAAEGYGVLMTTHHPEHALIAASRVLLMRNGQIEADGPPQQVVNTAAIERLYGVPVDALLDREGSPIAFRPQRQEQAKCP
jgi:iron complex transport system ATP-binding protein